MKKTKIMALVATALCALTVGAVLASACGKSVDYTNYTYSQWKAVSYEEWNKKTISYQFHTNTKEGERMDVGFGASGCYTQVFLNLYDDGTAAYFQAGIYDTGASNQVWYDKDNYISWASFGQWEEKNGTLSIYLLGYFSAGDLIVTKDASFGENEGCTYVTMTAVDGVYTYTRDSVEQSTGSFMRYGINDNGEGMGIDQEMVGKTGGDIEYKTIQDWINTYINDQKGMC